MALKQASAKVLANKGVPIEVNILKREGHDLVWPPKVKLSSEEVPVVEERFVRLGNLQIADLEVIYGSLDAWQEGLRARPFDTIIQTLAVCWSDDETLASLPHDPVNPLASLRRRALGTMLVDTKIDEYATAIGGAFMLANGVEPDAVGKALKQGVAASAKTQERLMSQLRLSQELNDVELGETEQPTDSTSAKSPEPGAESVESSTSSGD